MKGEGNQLGQKLRNPKGLKGQKRFFNYTLNSKSF